MKYKVVHYAYIQNRPHSEKAYSFAEACAIASALSLDLLSSCYEVSFTECLTLFMSHGEYYIVKEAE